MSARVSKLDTSPVATSSARTAAVRLLEMVKALQYLIDVVDGTVVPVVRCQAVTA